MPDDPEVSLADSVYEQLRSELFDFRLLPGDRFSEIEVAERTGTGGPTNRGFDVRSRSPD